MRSFRKVIQLRVPQRMAFVNITPQVEAALAESGVREGISREAARQVFDAVRRGAEQEAG